MLVPPALFVDDAIRNVATGMRQDEVGLSCRMGKIPLPRGGKKTAKKRPRRPDGLGFAGAGPGSPVRKHLQ